MTYAVLCSKRTNVMADLRANTPEEHWLFNGGWHSYRGARVELHDEWSWGWMVRKADGSMVEGIAGDD